MPLLAPRLAELKRRAKALQASVRRKEETLVRLGALTKRSARSRALDASTAAIQLLQVEEAVAAEKAQFLEIWAQVTASKIGAVRRQCVLDAYPDHEVQALQACRGTLEARELALTSRIADLEDHLSQYSSCRRDQDHESILEEFLPSFVKWSATWKRWQVKGLFGDSSDAGKIEPHMVLVKVVRAAGKVTRSRSWLLAPGSSRRAGMSAANMSG